MRKFIICLMAPILFLYGCSPVNGKQERTAFALDTVITVTVYGGCSERIWDDCFDELERLEMLFSVTREGSELSRINAANGAAVAVSRETMELLTLATQISAMTGGAFDMTVRPVTKLWNFTAEQPSLPDAALLASACERVDYRRISLGDGSVTVNGELEPGGIAKGYIADRLRELLIENDVTSALIDLGGNIVAVGDKGGEPFRIGIKDPANVASLAAIVQVSDRSVVTSGTYERGFTLNGVRYHHLLDPKNGMPVQNGLASVTIVSESSALADALSTACFVMGEQAARELLIAFPEVQAMFIYEDGRLSVTDGLHKNPDGEYVLA